MSIVYKTTSNRARTAVHVLVGTPDCEVDVPVVELDWYIAHSVSEVPADGYALALRVSGDLAHVEELACIELDAWEQKQSSFRRVFVDNRKNVLCWHDWALLRRRLDKDH